MRGHFPHFLIIKIQKMCFNAAQSNYKEYVELKNSITNIAKQDFDFIKPNNAVGIFRKIKSIIMEQTLGQKRVKAEFNPSKDELVDQIKNKTAELIDLLQRMRADEASKTYEKSPEEKNIQSGEKFRLISLAQTSYEEAAMWAVKANFS